MIGNGRVELTRPWVVLALAVALACGAAGLARAQEEPPEGVVVDSSGLWWSEPMGATYTGTFTWAQAGLAAESFAVGVYDDWRLPTASELLDACEDGTLPAWLEAMGDDWFWEEPGWSPYAGDFVWFAYGGGAFWSCERDNKKNACQLWVSIDNEDVLWGGPWYWHWWTWSGPQTWLGSAFFVRGRPVAHGNGPKKK